MTNLQGVITKETLEERFTDSVLSIDKALDYNFVPKHEGVYTFTLFVTDTKGRETSVKTSSFSVWGSIL
jgi:hypothetical protein